MKKCLAILTFCYQDPQHTQMICHSISDHYKNLGWQITIVLISKGIKEVHDLWSKQWSATFSGGFLTNTVLQKKRELLTPLESWLVLVSTPNLTEISNS